MIFKKSAISTGLALGLVAGVAQAQMKWDMPTPYPDSNFHTRNVRQFADDISKASGGKLQIVVHSGNSLIKHPEIKRAVQTGQVPIAETLVSILANEAAVFAYDSNPFLAPSYEKQRKLYQAAKPVLEKRLDGQGVTMLYSVPWPPTAIHTKKEVNSLADFKGMRLRSFSPITSRLAELLGANPVLIQAPEVPQAFRTGMIDAQINSAAGGVDTQTWDSTSHVYNVQAILPQNMVIASKAALAKLDPAILKAVRDASTAAETRGWAASEAELAKSLETLTARGVKSMSPPPKLAAELQEIGKKMTAEWVARAGAEGEAILKAYGN